MDRLRHGRAVVRHIAPRIGCLCRGSRQSGEATSDTEGDRGAAE